MADIKEDATSLSTTRRSHAVADDKVDDTPWLVMRRMTHQDQ